MDTTITNEPNSSVEKISPNTQKQSEKDLMALTPPSDSPLPSSPAPSTGSSITHSSSHSRQTSGTNGSEQRSPPVSSPDQSETETSSSEDEEQQQLLRIGAGLKSVTFDLPAQEARLVEREQRIAELEAQLKKREQEVERRENELNQRSEDWNRQYESKKQELIELEARATSAQSGRESLRRSIGTDGSQLNSVDRKSLGRPCTINEEETDTCNSVPSVKCDTYEDDDFDIKTPPRTFARPSIGQWSSERRRNNMSVKSMIGNFENTINKSR